MKHPLLYAAGIALAFAVAAPTLAQQPSPRPAMSGPDRKDDRKDDRSREDRARDSDRRAPAKPAPKAVVHKDRYGTWNSAWGKRPGAAPAHWSKKGDWYRHVRACKNKYLSYNARTDTYRLRSGKTVRCKL